MPEEGQGGKKILGMPRKVAIPVLGIAIVVVAFVLLRRRATGGAIPRMAPETGGGGFGGGGGGGYQTPTLGQIVASTPVNPIQEMMDRLGFEREQFKYNVEQRRETERQRDFEINFEEKRSTLDAFLNLLPFQFETQRQREESLQARFQTDIAREGAQEEFFRTEEVAQRRLTEKAGDAPVKCPPGMHPVNMPGVGLTCRPLGDPDGGRGFNPIRLVTDIVGGFLTGVGQAAPGIGAGAAQYGAAQAGIIPGRTSRQPIGSAPGINPEPFDSTPYRFTGSTETKYGGIA